MIGNQKRNGGWLTHSAGDYARVAEALVALCAARLIVRFAPFQWTMSCVRLRAVSRRAKSVNVMSVVDAIDRGARKSPFRARCFEQALAANWMLSRRGLPSSLHYGIRTVGHSLEAHVWLSVDGTIVLGGENAQQFAEVGQWPTEPATV